MECEEDDDDDIAAVTDGVVTCDEKDDDCEYAGAAVCGGILLGDSQSDVWVGRLDFSLNGPEISSAVPSEDFLSTSLRSPSPLVLGCDGLSEVEDIFL